MYFLLNLSQYVKSCGHFCQILGFFTMPAHQIWSSHVTQETNFEKFLCFSNSAFNIRKSSKVLAEKPSTSEVISQKPHGGGGGGGGKHPQCFRVKVAIVLHNLITQLFRPLQTQCRDTIAEKTDVSKGQYGKD